MNKSKTLEHLDNARRAHIKWLNRAKSIIDGALVVRDPHPLASTECAFGLWFNKEGTNLYDTLQIEGLETIHSLHNQLHDKYLLIYETFFGSAEGIVYDRKAKLTKRNVLKTEEDQAKQHFTELRELSYMMLQEIENLQKHIETEVA